MKVDRVKITVFQNLMLTLYIHEPNTLWTTLDGLENLLVTIDDHFGRVRKFACD